MAELERALAGIDAELAEPGTWSDAAAAASLGQRQAQLRADLEAAESELLDLYG